MKLKFAFLALLVGFVAAEEVAEKENLAMVCGNSCNVRICCAIYMNRKSTTNYILIWMATLGWMCPWLRVRPVSGKVPPCKFSRFMLFGYE